MLLALLALGGCITSTGRYGLFTDTAIASIDKTAAKVGEEVTVTLTGTLALRAESELPDTDFKDVLLGACFRRESDSVRVGYCGGDTPKPLPDWIKVSPRSDSHIKQFGTINIQRGKSRTVTVTFSFTSTVPAQLLIQPWFYSDSRLGDYGFGTYTSIVDFVE